MTSWQDDEVPPEETRQLATTLGLSIDAAQWEELERLVELWRRYGRAMNLTADLDEDALWNHVGDGLATVRCAALLVPLSAEAAWIDIGSGGGFPGLVAAALTECPLTLIEPRQRRASFLELALSALRRGDAVVRRARVERSTWDEEVVGGVLGWERAKFSILTARAVWSPAEWLELGISLLRGRPGAVLAHCAPSANPPKPPHASIPSPLGTIHGWRQGVP